MPSSPSRQTDLEALIAQPFAHRGLHGTGLVENSRGAFRAALAAGHGIELDVQASADQQAIVFHDYDLSRLTGSQGKIAEFPAAALGKIQIRGTAEVIPALPEILALIGGQQALLIEVKSPGRQVAALAASVAGAIRDDDGPVGVMSFNPQIGHWFAANAPEVLRGLVVTEAGKRWRGRIARFLALRRATPDFLAYDIRDLPSRFAGAQRAKGLPVLTWTCRSDEDHEVAAKHADQIIYELPA